MFEHEGHMNLESCCASSSFIGNDKQAWCHSLEQLPQGMSGLCDSNDFSSHLKHLVSLPGGATFSVSVADSITAGVGAGKGRDIVF